MPHQYLLKLYITGNNPKSAHAIANLQRLCEEEFDGQCRIEIVDVMEDPQAAEDERIIATPTLVKAPNGGPERRVIGDLSETEKVREGLALASGKRDSSGEPS